MNNYILAAISFGVGAAVSGITSWLIVKKKYEKRHQAEMDAVWEDLMNGKRDEDSASEEPATKLSHSESAVETVLEKPNLFDYASKVKDLGYDTASDELSKTNDRIYEISENDLDEDLYDQIPITLYADGIFADDQDYPMKRIEDYFPEDIYRLMEGKDSIWIRNEIKKTDYEICRSQLTFGEMLDRHPETEQRIAYDDALTRYYDENDTDEGDEE